jgi:hypothetical protein
MGMVYRAEHTQLGRPAALKMLLPQLSSDPAIVQRFFNEARAASAIDHPGIVEVYDFGSAPNGAAYIVMALLKGESLAQRLERGPMAPLEGASIVAQVLGALAAAHARGIVHRDLKPDNIFLVPNELMANGVQVKLLDFGIAKLGGDSGTGGGFKTQTGMMMGTPAYMSPEQCMGRADLDHRTDLYAIGCILFHVLTGRPPFTGEGGTGMMIAAHMRDPAPHPRTLDPNVPERLATIVMKLLEKDPAARYQSALETRQALVDAGASAPSKPPVSAAHQYDATLPPTAAAPVSTMKPAGPPAKRGKRLAITIGALAVAGIAVAVVFGSRTHDAPTPPAQAAAAPPTSPPPPAGRPVEPQASVTTEEPCPLGKVRGFDTHGHCCWPEQAYSTAKNQCVGTPACPDGHRPRGEDCVAVAAIASDKTVAASATSVAPALVLASKSFAPGAQVTIGFASKISSPPTSRAWVTIVAADAADAQYEVWSYVDDGATSLTLTAPNAPGAYEVRLHTDYPKQSFNVRQRVAIRITDAAGANTAGTPRSAQLFIVGKQVAAPGESVELTFPVPMKAATGEKFWVTVVAKGEPASAYGHYEYVPDGARTLAFEMPQQPGDYEIRLHANYPRLTTHLVHRVPIRVED